MNERIVYFSLNSIRKDSFYRYVKATRICYTPKYSFTLEGEKDEFHDPRDLITLIERTSKKDSLHIIIDYVSLCGTGEEINYSTVLRDIIMCYPEVQFLFDETFVQKSRDEGKSKYNFMNFLFWKSLFKTDDKQSKVLADYHQFNLKDFQKKTAEEQFIRLLKGCNNMYDASNLRYTIKSIKREELSVEQNYRNLQESRYNHVAVVAEEEYHQNMFNAYCLYACGYRVFPVVTATELLWINSIIEKEKERVLKELKTKLQLWQKAFEKSEIEGLKKAIESIEGLDGINTKIAETNEALDGIKTKIAETNNEEERGRFEAEKKKIEAEKKEFEAEKKQNEECFFSCLSELTKKLRQRATKTVDAINKEILSLRRSLRKQKEGYEKDKCSIETEIKEKQNNLQIIEEITRKESIGDFPLLLRDYDLQFIDEDHVEQTHGNSENEVDYIRGAKRDKETGKYTLVEKDASGAPNPYWKSFISKTTYFVSKGEKTINIKLKYNETSKTQEVLVDHMKSVDTQLILRGIKKPMEGIYASMRRIPIVQERYDDSREIEDNSYNTNRLGVHGHSCPLNIYGIARSMVHRSECYYQNGRHRLAAIVAGEALEVLNGFHKSLIKRAYYIQAVSENAMAMSLLGGYEGRLSEDVKFRLKTKVRKDIKRMLEDKTDRFNVLYNIFNDCHLFCQEKEYFQAADEALSIMVSEKEGWDFKVCWGNLIEWFAKFKKCCYKSDKNKKNNVKQ